ncbi:MAG: tetratricopeptide repeat protein [Lachnospiraceae bacterium]|nr:tetratricopeptide repeat protein [Lachnospiraceae bacterium]
MINREDYEEPRCALCMNPKERIPVDRVIEKLDAYLEDNDLNGAERHLKYWLSEAEVNKDEAGELTVLGELMGFMRKNGRMDEALSYAESALGKVEKYGYSDTVTGATAVLNAGTVFRSSGKCIQSAECYEKAKKIYEESLDPNDDRLGGLYNNYASTLCELERYDEAIEKYDKALKIMSRMPNGRIECAVTYLNLADLYVKRDGNEASESRTDELLDKAYECLTDPDNEKNAYYKFILDKCIPAYDYFGQFIRSSELKDILHSY